MIRTLAWIVMMLAAPALAQAPPPQQGTSNPVPGSVWTYYGPTFGAGWGSAGFALGTSPSVVNEVVLWGNTLGTALKSSDATSGATATVTSAWSNAFMDSLRVNINGFPTSGEFGQAPGTGHVDLASAIVGAINVPSSATSNNAAGYGIAGYGRTVSPTYGAVGTGGYGQALAASSNAWGVNSSATNSPYMAPQVPNSGSDFGGLWGAEINVAVMKKSDGSAPGGTVRGLSIVGNSEVVPSPSPAGYFALTIGPFGNVFTPPPIPWQIGLTTSDQAATVGISLGSVGLPNTTSASQPIVFVAYNGSENPLTASIWEKSNGSLAYNAFTNAVHEFRIDGYMYEQISKTNVALLPLGPGNNQASVNLSFTSVTPGGTSNTGSIGQTAAGSLVINAPLETLIQTNNVPVIQTGGITPGLADTALNILANNSAGGIGLKHISLGAADSCGVGFRCMRIPN